MPQSYRARAYRGPFVASAALSDSGTAGFLSPWKPTPRPRPCGQRTGHSFSPRRAAFVRISSSMRPSEVAARLQAVAPLTETRRKRLVSRLVRGLWYDSYCRTDYRRGVVAGELIPGHAYRRVRHQASRHPVERPGPCPPRTRPFLLRPSDGCPRRSSGEGFGEGHLV
jgi:hypothetical protein